MHIDRAFMGLLVLGPLAGRGNAAESVRLPLRWLNKQAYVTTVAIDGKSTLLQVGTYDYTTWVACSRFGDGKCDTDRSAGKMSVENGFLSVSYLQSKTLTVGSVSYANSASMLRAEYDADMASKLPLVGQDTQGVLGLGPSNGLSCNPSDGTCVNVSVYLSSRSDGAGSFVQIGDDASFIASVLSSTTITTRYALSLRATDVAGWQNKRWYISLGGVRFGDSPREPGGDDTKALVSLNHATLQMPPAVHTRFKTMHLSGCNSLKSVAIGGYYECDAALLNSLPRLGLYVKDKILYLEAADYAQVSSTDSKKLVVYVASNELDDSWVLGAPFLRKFPTTLSIESNTISVYCTTGSSCDGPGDVLERPVVVSPEPTDRPTADTPTPSHDGSSGSPGGGVAGPIRDGSDSHAGGGGSGGNSTGYVVTSIPPSSASSSQNTKPHSSSGWELWFTKGLAIFVAVTLVAAVAWRVWRRRQQVDEPLELQQPGHIDGTGTVVSAEGTEETKEELLVRGGDEATPADRHDRNYVGLQSPASR